jgi:hypothetical protein
VTPGAEPDPYAILGVPRSATQQEVRAAYRVLAARYHPDRHQGNPLEELASAKMAEINRAYAILSDPARRTAFDRGRAGVWAAASPTPGAAPGARAPSGKRIALLLALPLLLLVGVPLLRVVAILARDLFEALALLRGTPLGAVAVLLAIVVLLVALVRRRRVKAPPGGKK